MRRTNEEIVAEMSEVLRLWRLKDLIITKDLIEVELCRRRLTKIIKK